jgi:uncharacterized protein (DUF924 family)
MMRHQNYRDTEHPLPNRSSHRTFNAKRKTILALRLVLGVFPRNMEQGHPLLQVTNGTVQEEVQVDLGQEHLCPRNETVEISRLPVDHGGTPTTS